MHTSPDKPTQHASVVWRFQRTQTCKRSWKLSGLLLATCILPSVVLVRRATTLNQTRVVRSPNSGRRHSTVLTGIFAFTDITGIILLLDKLVADRGGKELWIGGRLAFGIEEFGPE